MMRMDAAAASFRHLPTLLVFGRTLHSFRQTGDFDAVRPSPGSGVEWSAPTEIGVEHQPCWWVTPACG
jgi:hypothetical protein